MAEQLGRGLQNLVDRCDSGSRLDFHPLGEWWNGIHDRLKICWASAHEGSTPSSPSELGFRAISSVCAIKHGASATL